MLKRFNNQMPLAVMAYNAGPGNVNKFLRNLRNLDLDEFIENIPIDETRGYVKRVMRSMQVYASIYDEAELGNSIVPTEVWTREVRAGIENE
jgi:soluble lytic murein transglycosylase